MQQSVHKNKSRAWCTKIRMPTTLVQWARRKKPRDEAAALHSQPNVTDTPYEVLAPYLRAARVLVRRQDHIDARTADLRALERRGIALRKEHQALSLQKDARFTVQEWDLERRSARACTIENEDARRPFLVCQGGELAQGLWHWYDPSPWWERENPWLLCSFVPCGYDRNEFVWILQHQSALVDRRCVANKDLPVRHAWFEELWPLGYLKQHGEGIL